jgi:hypothetical protein
LIVLRELRTARRSWRIAASLCVGIRSRPKCLPCALARAKPAFPLGNEGALEFRQQFTGIKGS